MVKRIKPGDLNCRFTAFFDGCCEPVNPGGTAGYGAAIFEGYKRGAAGRRVHEVSGLIEPSPTTSNNVAEYLAVNSILDWLIDNAPRESCNVFGDSRLVICQLWGWPVLGKRKWKIHGVDVKLDKTPGRYAEHAVASRAKLKRLPRCLGFWIPRDENGLADELSKAPLLRTGVEFRIQPESVKEPSL